jgi:plasmid replication initiation protein
MKRLPENSIEVRHSNVITQSRHELSAAQLDLYFMMLSLIRENDEVDKMYEISVREIESITGRMWQYNQLLVATEGMIGKVLRIDQHDGVLQIALLSSAKYVRGKGKIELSIDPKLRPYLIDIKNNFTSFQLHCVLSLSSKYAKWMYLQFSRWKDVGYVLFEINELKILLNLKDPNGKLPEQYTQWIEFKKRVLDTSVKQINESTDLKISYELEKKGRSFHKIHFTIIRTNKYQTVIPFEVEETDREALQLKNKMYNIGTRTVYTMDRI